jgi:molecular chaperone DnaJ
MSSAETFRDPWVILGVARDATDAEIKHAYRALAKRYHPDRNRGNDEAEARFAEISRAYDQIGSAETRAVSAANLRARQNIDSFTPINSDLAATFGEERPDPANQSPKARRVDLQVTFREAFTGTTKTMKVDGEESCGACGGSGAAPGVRARRCDACRGQGVHTAGRLRSTCAACDGRGFTVATPCPHCDGGIIRRQRPITVTVVPGIADKTELRLKDRTPGSFGDEILVTVHVAPSATFVRTQDPADLSVDVPISYSEACLGARIKIPTPDRTLVLRIPEATPSGQILRVSGAGMPRLQDPSQRGDLFCRVGITVPEKLSHQQRRLLTQLAHYDDPDKERVERFSAPS